MLFRPDGRKWVHIQERCIHGGASAFSLPAQEALFLHDLNRTGWCIVVKSLAVIIELELLRLLRQSVISDRNRKLVGLECD